MTFVKTFYATIPLCTAVHTPNNAPKATEHHTLEALELSNADVPTPILGGTRRLLRLGEDVGAGFEYCMVAVGLQSPWFLSSLCWCLCCLCCSGSKPLGLCLCPP